MEALLRLKIPANRIIFVEPIPTGLEVPDMHMNTLLFNDNDVDQAVHNEIREIGITVYPHYYFVDWELDDDTGSVTTAKFESKSRILELPLFAMIIYAEKSVSQRTYNAINNSGLMYDSKLVIETDCKTNDPHIYAAGTGTKYSSKYYADHMQHKLVSHLSLLNVITSYDLFA